MSNYQRNKLLVVFFLLGSLTYSFAQPKINSPYSRFGLGEQSDLSFSQARGMASLGAAYNDPFHININNPASLAFLGTAIFDFGGHIKNTNLEGGGASNGITSGSLDYMSLGFITKNPINRAATPPELRSPWHWGMNFAFTTNSTVGYDLTVNQNTAATDTLDYQFQGSGGTFKVLWGNGVRYKNIALGFNLGYVFGKTTAKQYVEFENLDYAYRNRFSDEFSVGGLVWNIGAQYKYEFKKIKDGIKVPDGRQLTVGAYGNSQHNVDFNTSQLYEKVNYPFPGNTTRQIVDTIVNTEDNILGGKLPAEFGVGVYFSKVNAWGLGIDYKTTAWSGYNNPIRPTESLQDAFRVAVGGNITPNYRSIGSYFAKINYQLGGYYAKDSRSSFDNSLTDYGVTFGLGLPVINRKQQTSYINFSFALGQLSSEKTSIKETYGKLTVGFTLNNNEWFLKRKFY